MKQDGFHHGNLRLALVEAGLAAVEARGAEAVSLRDLAREVGVSPTAAYRHFADKDALFAEIAERGFKKLAEVSAQVLIDDPRERLFGLALAYAGFATAHPKLYQLMFAEPLDMAAVARLSDAGTESYRPLRDALTEILGPQADEAQLVDALVRVWSVLHGYLTLRMANRLPRLATTEDRLEPVLRPVLAAL